MPSSVGLGVRQTVAAGLLFALGLLIIWVGFGGLAGRLLGALLCPAQLVEGGEEPSGIRPSDIAPSITQSFQPGGQQHFR